MAINYAFLNLLCGGSKGMVALIRTEGYGCHFLTFNFFCCRLNENIVDVSS
jgi:hypothetical protein